MYFNENSLISLNGDLKKMNHSLESLFAQTMHYGYGVFEGIRAYQTEDGAKIFKAEEHYERLKKSCEYLHIPFEYSVDELVAHTYELLEANGLQDAYIRPLVFAEANMSLTAPKQSQLMIAVWHWGAYMGDKLLKVKTSSYCRPHPRSTHIEAKACGHYVNSTLATIEAKEHGFDEALLLDSEGFLAEGSGSNLFFELNSKLYTPQLGQILAGITRATVIELCEDLNIEVEEGQFSPEMLKQADSAFFCGTAAEIIGFEQLDNYCFPLAWEQSLGKKLQDAYRNLVVEKNETWNLTATARP